MKAFDVITGSTIRAFPMREVCVDLIEYLEGATSGCFNVSWRELAKMTDEDHEELDDLVSELIEQVNCEVTMPAFCSVDWHDGEIICRPDIDQVSQEINDGEVKAFEELPEKFEGTVVVTVNDHGNMSCYVWNTEGQEYVEQWAVV